MGSIEQGGSLLYEVIDLEFRPETYWPESPDREQLLARINGQDRREMARRILDEEGFEALGGFLGRTELPEEELEGWGRLHPHLMGGEYLPSLAGNEVEIARISLQSVTFDQISLRARRCERVIRYRVVDEYDTKFPLARKTSKRPLSLGELIALIDESNHPEETRPGGLLISHWEFAHEYDDTPEEAVAFAAIESAYYPQLEEHYRLRSRQWRLEKLLVIREARRAERRLRAAEEREAAKRRKLLEPFEHAIRERVDDERKSWPKPGNWAGAAAQGQKAQRLLRGLEDYALEHGILPDKLPEP